MDPLIKVDNLTKIFGTYLSKARVTSLRDITFNVKKGERVCLFGPNGAGKSTIMKALMGLVNVSKGSISINGIDARKDPVAIKKMIGYLPSELAFYPNIPCKESLFHFALLRGLSWNEAKKEANELLQLVGLSNWWDLPPKLMSSGMKQRFSLALAIVGDPEIILFDEPIAFIDVQGKMKIYQLVHDYVNKSDKTVIMSTHNIQDALIMSDRLIVIDKGKIILDGPITKVINEKCRLMEIILSEEKPSEKEIYRVIGEEDYEISGRKILVRSDNALQISTMIINKLQENKISVFSFRPFVEQRREKQSNNKEDNV
ncbi:MAG: ABC transporter ATP-binding protein [Asgard group archaeon]|nr:ABC transporter ATP-binding protein [Asgard group archaeon]